jgi:cytochrome c oxidase accessory protein FixG
MQQAAHQEAIEEISFRDRIPTVTEKGKRHWIYAWKPSGRFTKWRQVLSAVYIVLFFTTPFLRINGNPVLQLNIPEGKFSILGMLFWPQDFFIFGTAMVTFIIFIVLFTQIYGRLFCGWACPQTIFMEMVFRRIEWFIEGNPNRQRALNHGPWTGEKIAKKTVKHLLFFVLSFLIANTFLTYIIGTDALFRIIQDPVSQHVGGFIALLFFTGAFYFVYAYVREIVCTVVCPYGRLQGVLLDKNSVVVAYDYNRGEPRGRGRRPAEGLGDCIDCHQCVVVCPTGIDIRNGTQLECVNCTACIDACNQVMEKVGLPKGLVRYASENEIANKQRFQFTARMKVYSAILMLLIGLMGVMLGTRKDVNVGISRVGGQLYQEVGTDSLSNLYTVTWNNKTMQQQNMELRVENAPGVVKLVGEQPLAAAGGQQGKRTLFVVMPLKAIARRETPLKVGVYSNGEKVQTVKISFLGYVQ